MTSTPEQFNLKFDLPGILRLLGSNIYSDPKVCIREMVQNAHDSCTNRQISTGARGSSIRVSHDRTRRTLTFLDNGAGMTEQEIHEYLSTIGRGYTAELRQALEKGNRTEAERLIGQFGLGLLSAFSIADRVVITTRSCRAGSTGFRWECTGDARYTLVPADVSDIGTRVVIYVHQKHEHILEDDTIRRVIKRYGDFLPIPIYLGSEHRPINTMNPPWNRDGVTAEYVEYVKGRFDAPALEVIPINHDAAPTVRGVLYIPRSSVVSIGEYGDLDICVRGMLIKERDRKLLPRWARFVRGVIDSPALTPTVSRDELIEDETYQKVQAILGERVLAHFDHLARTDPRHLREIVANHNTLIKAWALEDDTFFDRVAHLVLFDTDLGKMSIPVYLERMQDRREIFYFKDVGSGTQQKVLFGARSVPVIDASYGAEESFLKKYANRNPQIRVSRLDADSGFIFEPVPRDRKWDLLEEQYRVEHKIDARVVRFEPADLPAVLVKRFSEGQDDVLEGILSSPSISDEVRALLGKLKTEKERATRGMLSRDMVLNLNADNPLVQKLREVDPRTQVYHVALTVVYNNAVLFGQHAISPENAVIMCRSNNKAVELLIEQAILLQSLPTSSAQS